MAGPAALCVTERGPGLSPGHWGFVFPFGPWEGLTQTPGRSSQVQLSSIPWKSLVPGNAQPQGKPDCREGVQVGMGMWCQD